MRKSRDFGVIPNSDVRRSSVPTKRRSLSASILIGAVSFGSAGGGAIAGAVGSAIAAVSHERLPPP